MDYSVPENRELIASMCDQMSVYAGSILLLMARYSGTIPSLTELLRYYCIVGLLCANYTIFPHRPG